MGYERTQITMSTTLSTPISARPIFYSDCLNEGHQRAGMWFLSDDERGFYWQAVVEYQTLETWWDTSEITAPAGVELSRPIEDIPTGRLKYWRQDGTPVETISGIGDGTYYAQSDVDASEATPAAKWLLAPGGNGARWVSAPAWESVERWISEADHPPLVGTRYERPIAEVPFGHLSFHDAQGEYQRKARALDAGRVYAFADGDGYSPAARWVRLPTVDALPVYYATTLTVDEYYATEDDRPQGVLLEAPIDQPPLGRLKYRSIGGHEVAVDHFAVEVYAEATDSDHGVELAGWWMPQRSGDDKESWVAVRMGETIESWWGDADELALGRMEFSVLRRPIDDVPVGPNVRLSYMGRDGRQYEQIDSTNYLVDARGGRTVLDFA